jgi:GH24 family phage-related lysozyme (muramidase)
MKIHLIYIALILIILTSSYLFYILKHKEEPFINKIVINKITVDAVNYIMCIQHIKQYERLSLTPYELDGKQYIGYGQQLDHTNKELLSGITEEYAKKLLENNFNKLLLYNANKYHLEGKKLLAVSLLTYNVGIGKVYNEIGNELFLLKEGYNEYYEKKLFRKWLSICHFQGQKHPDLIKRRNFEINLFRCQ